MTRKDYILIANLMNAQYRGAANHDKRGVVYQVAYYLSDALEKDNPRFDRAHFLAVVRGEGDIKGS